MKHINENPFEFFREGGWAFLGGAAGAEVRLDFVGHRVVTNFYVSLGFTIIVLRRGIRIRS
jgi:hypothetical protein